MKKGLRHTLIAALAAQALTFGDGAAAASVPQVLTEQGRLFDQAGVALQGSASITFTVYDAAVGGNALWTETQIVPLDDGYFSAALGALVPIPASVWDGAVRHVGIQIGADAEMSPRQATRSAPYAVIAGDAVGDIHPSSVSVNGQTVIDQGGNWVGPAMVGPTGPAGPQGPGGAQGPAGSQGPTGLQGAQGPAGVAGPIGPQGPIGPAGATGATGATGLTGATGPSGANGATGPQGPAGPGGGSGSGAVAQVVTVTDTGTYGPLNATVFSEVSQAWRATITPTSASSKLLITASFSINTQATLYFLRHFRFFDVTNNAAAGVGASGLGLRIPTTLAMRGVVYDDNDAEPLTLRALVPAGSTLPRTYSVQWRVEQGTGNTCFSMSCTAPNSTFPWTAPYVITI
ncbi:MAG: hypothetical protein ABI193_15470, partial [Minicystis sp.]